MTRRIWKYEVPVDDRNHDVPARVVHVAPAEDRVDAIQVWCEVDDETLHTMPHRVFGTGQPVPIEYEYRGSVQAGPFVWHLYAYVAF